MITNSDHTIQMDTLVQWRHGVEVVAIHKSNSAVIGGMHEALLCKHFLQEGWKREGGKREREGRGRGREEGEGGKREREGRGRGREEGEGGKREGGKREREEIGRGEGEKGGWKGCVEEQRRQWWREDR